MSSQIITRGRILRHLLTPIQKILARIVPDHLEKALDQESVREKIVTLADQALVSAQPTARLVPSELRRRLIRRQLDVLLDNLLLPDADTEALEEFGLAASEAGERPAEASEVAESRPAPLAIDSTTTEKVIAALDALLGSNSPELQSVPEATRLKVIGRLVRLVVGQLGAPAEDHVETPEPPAPGPITPETFVPTRSTMKLLLDFEVGGGQPYYDRFLKVPTFPGFSSGVTIGIGYDLGFHTPEEIREDWNEWLTPAELKRVVRCSGIHAGRVGPAQVRSIAMSLKDIAIPWEAALEVFNAKTIPRQLRRTLEAFPGADRLHPEIIGALLSLVLNRGTSMRGERRKEMREIREAISRGAIEEIPRQIRAMKRYWGTRETLSNLLGRREREAQLVESGLRGGSLELHPADEDIPDLGDFPGPIVLGDVGPNVRILQRALASLGHGVTVDGEFGPQTLAAVKAFQRRAGITVDGEVGPVTWAVLRGDEAPKSSAGQEKREKLAQIADEEAKKKLRWTDPACEAEAYLRPLREPMRKLGHLGEDVTRYNWCAAFVTFCARKADYNIPDQPEGIGATMALVESWKFWAKQNNWWLSPSDTTLQRGDIVTFEWNDGDPNLDHIGIVQSYTPGSTHFHCSEGNHSNQAGNFSRPLSSVAGIIRLREAV